MLYNIICVSCGCIGHDRSDYTLISVLDQRLSCLKVEPRGLLLYDFPCRISALDEQNIMIDPVGYSKTTRTRTYCYAIPVIPVSCLERGRLSLSPTFDGSDRCLMN